jgi:tRNA modification GTPase
MTGPPSDTIFAVGTATGRAAIAVVRLSGPATAKALRRMTGKPLPAPRRAARRSILGPGLGPGGSIDEGLVLWFPGPASYTGEDMAEIHLHGGRATVAGCLRALGAIQGLRPAEAGEFTRRAFENGKLELTAAEGIADLIAAETQAQARQALRQMQGELGRLYDGWRDRLGTALARSEAWIDFPEDGVPDAVIVETRRTVRAVAEEIRRHLDDGRRGERLRAGVSVALIGPPNVGKSSLLNFLARRDAAIVSATAGTTRDIIEVHLDLAGYPVVVADTAGLREAGDEVEAEGVRRALARANEADLRVAMFDAAAWPEIDPATAALVDPDTIVAMNKTDIAAVPSGAAVAGVPALAISLRTGVGLEALLDRLAKAVEACAGPGEAPALTRERHRHALAACAEALERIAGTQPVELPGELIVEDLRLAVRELGRITGRVDIEELLDKIFREFCIGK